MSFVEQDDVFQIVEDFLIDASGELSDKKIITETAGRDALRSGGKFFSLSYDEALEKYGTDKPDLRFGLAMVDVADIFTRSSNEIFSKIGSDSENNRIKALRVPGANDVFSKTQMKGFEEFVRKHGAAGLGYFQMTDEGLK